MAQFLKRYYDVPWNIINNIDIFGTRFLYIGGICWTNNFIFTDLLKFHELSGHVLEEEAILKVPYTPSQKKKKQQKKTLILWSHVL